MIIFDLDGTLADCEHRRHFVDPSKDPKAWKYTPDDWHLLDKYGSPCTEQKWKPDWKAFYEACDQDILITPTMTALRGFWVMGMNIQIWSGRCESVRDKTIEWISKYLECYEYNFPFLKMRPIGDNTPDDQLKERWLDEYLNMPGVGKYRGQANKVDFVFDDRPKVIRMWRRRGIFVFNCCQHDEEF